MQQAFKYIHDALAGLYPEPEIKSISFLLVEKITGYARTDIIVNKSTIFSEEQRLQVITLVEKLRKNIPVQYILGSTQFYGLDLLVNESVLIPRPETEELVEWIHCDNAGRPSLKILDAGTGTGCIALALKSLLHDAVIDAIDISSSALNTAKENAERNRLDVSFTEMDILQPVWTNKEWDIIVSNPPYIPEKEKTGMDRNVLEYEPHLALFVPDDDPLLFYRKIAETASACLRDNGRLYFEIHFNMGPSAANMLKDMGFKNVELRKDMSGIDRMIRAAR